MHHPMFGLHYDDYGSIIKDFLPIIDKYDFDVYFNGHEHLLNYATVDRNATFKSDFTEAPKAPVDCNSSVEWFP